MMHDFCIGDRVICKREYDRRIRKDLRGTVITIPDISFIGVEWDENIGGHDLGGRCEDGYGWVIKARYVEFATDEEDYEIEPATDKELAFLYS